MAQASQKIFFEFGKNGFIRKNSQEIVGFHLASVKTGGSLALNALHPLKLGGRVCVLSGRRNTSKACQS